MTMTMTTEIYRAEIYRDGINCFQVTV
jgi:hypothetical protein